MNAAPVDKRAVVEVTLLLSSILVAFALQRPVLFVGGFALCAVYVLLAHRRLIFKARQVFLFLLLTTLFLPAFFKPYFGLSPQFYFFNTLVMFLGAIALTRHPPEVLLWLLRISYGCFAALIMMALYIHWGKPEPLGEIISGSSTNGIPSYLIVVQVGLSLCNYLVHRQLPLVSALTTFVVAFYGYGRGSLVVAAMIVVISLAYDIALWRSAGYRRRAMLLLFTLAITFGLAKYGNDFGNLLNSYTKLGAGLIDPNRLEIWEQYIGKINTWTFLFGADYSGTVIEAMYQGNPHISYIRTHAFFGLPVTLLALLSPFLVFFSKKAWNTKIVFFTFIFMVSLRATSEPILFPTLLDLYYFSFFILFFRYAPEAKTSPAQQRVLAIHT